MPFLTQLFSGKANVLFLIHCGPKTKEDIRLLQAWAISPQSDITPVSAPNPSESVAVAHVLRQIKDLV